LGILHDFGRAFARLPGPRSFAWAVGFRVMGVRIGEVRAVRVNAGEVSQRQCRAGELRGDVL